MHLEKTRLRGHHIVAAFNARKTSEDRYSGSPVQQKIYGKEFLAASYRHLNRITEDTLVEIVEGVDDICELGCPFYVNCKNRRYDLNMKAFSGLFPDEEINPEYFDLDIWDADELELRGLRGINEILFKDIKP